MKLPLLCNKVGYIEETNTLNDIMSCGEYKKIVKKGNFIADTESLADIENSF